MPVVKIRKKLDRDLKAPDLTARQGEVLRTLLVCLLSGYLPTYRELAEELGITSPNGVTQHLLSLERKGYVEMHHGIGYQLTDKSLDLVL